MWSCWAVRVLAAVGATGTGCPDSAGVQSKFGLFNRAVLYHQPQAE